LKQGEIFHKRHDNNLVVKEKQREKNKMAISLDHTLAQQLYKARSLRPSLNVQQTRMSKAERRENREAKKEKARVTKAIDDILHHRQHPDLNASATTLVGVPFTGSPEHFSLDSQS